MDVFLGVFQPSPAAPQIWDLDSTVHLHNKPTRSLHQPLYHDELFERDRLCCDHSTRTHRQQGSSSQMPHRIAIGSTEARGAISPLRAQKMPSTKRWTRIFTAFYPPVSWTSFDDLMSRPRIATATTPWHVERQPLLVEATSAPESSKHSGTTCGPTDSRAPVKRLNATQGGICVEHLLWATTVTWSGAMSYAEMRDTLERRAVGGSSLRVMLPKEFIEYDLWKANSDQLIGGSETLAEAESLYAHFSTDACVTERVFAAVHAASMFPPIRVTAMY